jgi:hypothetical protein
MGEGLDLIGASIAPHRPMSWRTTGRAEGLIAVDYDNDRERTLRDSAALYADSIDDL